MDRRFERTETGRLALDGLARLVIALATGLPLRSAGKLVPRADDGRDLFFGV